MSAANVLRPIWLAPALLAAPALLLAACGSEKNKDDRTASGQVLQGSISDEMLPLETVTSKPPLIRESSGGGPGAAASEEAGEDAEALDAQQPVVPAAPSEAVAE
ncbi:hypothetical protein H0274_12745 [Altererythrobacter sp. CC-YST694]|uniref:hypothetical protein n=1 Tax=Altererythrobacter sp. CC-YST694 TaxID=2755038 RepID=UPI001D0060E5|nr:hypothetical protein [Altererythrobacter sp. CC-YST694]MCB5426130.1 hypothetical protein [Altererythrobacter sp. CC-YST694]